MPDKEVSFGKRIRELREKQGFKIRPAAKQLGINPSYLCDIENENSIPGEDLVCRMAKVYRVNESVKEALVFTARQIPKQIEEIKKKFPNASKPYFELKS